MILATKSGWLIAGKVERETERRKLFISSDGYSKEKWISNSSKLEKLFEDIDEALEWIDADDF